MTEYLMKIIFIISKIISFYYVSSVNVLLLSNRSINERGVNIVLFVFLSLTNKRERENLYLLLVLFISLLN